MRHLDTFLAEGNYSEIGKVFDDNYLEILSQELQTTEDWIIARVSDNGDAYMIMPTIRRQKLITREDTENPVFLKAFDDIEELTYQQAEARDIDRNKLETVTLQLIRSDAGDFFGWHTDGKVEVPREQSFYTVLGPPDNDCIGGEVEFWNGKNKDPILIKLDPGEGIAYHSWCHTTHHKILRGTLFSALCILAPKNE